MSEPLYKMSGFDNFEDWYQELLRVGRLDDAEYVDREANEKGSLARENWTGYFEDGYRPWDAWNEDCSYD